MNQWKAIIIISAMVFSSSILGFAPDKRNTNNQQLSSNIQYVGPDLHATNTSFLLKNASPIYC